MKILEVVDDVVVFEVPASNRTITMLFDLSCITKHYYLRLPAMRFCAKGVDAWRRIGNFYLKNLYGVFLDDGGEVYPMMLPNVYKNGAICLGSMVRNYSTNNLEVTIGEIYSNFIQSEFTCHGENMWHFFENNRKQNLGLAGLDGRITSTYIDEFYGVWSGGGRDYDICSDLRVKKHREYIRESVSWRDASIHQKYLSMAEPAIEPSLQSLLQSFGLQT